MPLPPLTLWSIFVANTATKHIYCKACNGKGILGDVSFQIRCMECEGTGRNKKHIPSGTINSGAAAQMISVLVEQGLTPAYSWSGDTEVVYLSQPHEHDTYSPRFIYEKGKLVKFWTKGSFGDTIEVKAR